MSAVGQREGLFGCLGRLSPDLFALPSRQSFWRSLCFFFSWSFVWVYSVRRQGVSDRGLCGYHKARQGGEEGGGGARLGEMDGVGVLA